MRRGASTEGHADAPPSLTVSLIDAIGSTPLRVTHRETAVAVDIFRLEHA